MTVRSKPRRQRIGCWVLVICLFSFHASNPWLVIPPPTLQSSIRLSTLTRLAMQYTRREILKLGLAALPAAGLLKSPIAALAAKTAAKPNSKLGGVQVGVIAPYSFRGMSNNPEDLLKGIVKLGLSAVELQSEGFESWAGAPAGGRGAPRRGPGAAANPPSDADRRARGEELRKWRTSASMDKFKEL